MRYGNGVADNMLSVFQITNEENACLSLKKQAQFLKLHSISGRSFAPLEKYGYLCRIIQLHPIVLGQVLDCTRLQYSCR